MIWFTADQHFGHPGIIAYDKRPFSSVKKMNKALIINWNNIVDKGDIVYIVGDFCWQGPNIAMTFLSQLNGQLHLIRGNHDRLNKKYESMFVTVSYQKTVKAGGVKYVLSHYPFRTWAGKGTNTYNIHGHSHGNLLPLEGAVDVGCNLWNYTPTSLAQVKEFLCIS